MEIPQRTYGSWQNVLLHVTAVCDIMFHPYFNFISGHFNSMPSTFVDTSRAHCTFEVPDCVYGTHPILYMYTIHNTTVIQFLKWYLQARAGVYIVVHENDIKVIIVYLTCLHYQLFSTMFCIKCVIWEQKSEQKVEWACAIKRSWIGTTQTAFSVAAE